jgi:hypothetical protein
VISPGTYKNIYGGQNYIGPVGSASYGTVDYEYTVPSSPDPNIPPTDPVLVSLNVSETGSPSVNNYSFQQNSYTDVTLSGGIALHLNNYDGTYTQLFELSPGTEIDVSAEVDTDVDVSTSAGGSLSSFAQASINLSTPPPFSACGPFNVDVTTQGSSLTLQPNIILASYTPSDGQSLASAAAACGFQNFDWQQQILLLPAPSPFATNSGTPVTAPTLDPPNSGYTYPLTCADGTVSTAINGAFPYYYNPSGPPGDCFSLSYRESGGNTLTFGDNPADVCLPGFQWPLTYAAFLAQCGGIKAPPGSFLEFDTELVGIEPDGSPSAPLYSFLWTDNFNGTVGGASTTASDLPPDPDSGSGGITILSLNGVPVDNQPAPVDEPNSLLMLGGGLMLLLVITRNSRKIPDNAASR